MLKINATYNFYTLAPVILGGEHKNMKVKAVMGAAEAIKYSDIVTMHTRLKPTITGLPDSHLDCTYVLFETINNETVVFALEYLDQNSITEVSSINIRIDFRSAENQDIAVIRARLLELGYKDFTISTY